MIDDVAKSDEYYKGIRQRFAEERDVRLGFRPPGVAQYVTDLANSGFAELEDDPWVTERVEREPIDDFVEVLFIGAGFSALLTSGRLRELGVDSIRMVERAADVGGTWYWNRYPGVACDVLSYDYLPMLDETGYVPSRQYAAGEEIFEYCQMMARKWDLYDKAVFQTTVTSTTWLADEKMWEVCTDRGDRMRARFVVLANGILTKPKLPRIDGMESFEGHSFHTSRWDFGYTGDDLELLADKVVGIIGTGATAVQAIPNLGARAKELYVFQRTPSSIDVKLDGETDPEWAASLQPGWQKKRREETYAAFGTYRLPGVEIPEDLNPDQKLEFMQRANIDHMMRIHQRIDEIVTDPITAEALKPWYMFMCKRPCIHNEYLPTFNRANVHLIDTRGEGITKIDTRGPVFDGTTYSVDLLIYATGFDVQQTQTWNVIRGEGGMTLDDKYATGIRTLLGCHTHGFPNMFIMGGFQAAYSFNLTDILQARGDHIAECIDFTRRRGYTTIDATAEAEEWWVQEVIRNRGKTSRSSDCTPGYFNMEGLNNSGQDGNFNGSFLKYREHLVETRRNIEQNYTFA